MKNFILILFILGTGEISFSQPYLPLSAGTGNQLTGPLYGKSAVFSSGSTTSVQSVTTGSNYTYLSINGDNNKSWGFYHNANNFIMHEPGIADVMTWKAGGNIGIGTDNPQNKLEVVAAGIDIAGLMLKNSNQQVNDVLRVGFDVAYGGENGTFGTSIGAVATSVTPASRKEDLSFITFDQAGNGSTEKMRIAYNGNVGIGTTTPTERLSVNGKIRAKEIKVETTGWSDFVFEDDYKLPDLKETEAFIKDNKHLPEIPSAKEVEKEGINLGEMNVKLLQKVEELTLYLIESKKEVKDLQERMKKLEGKKARRQKSASL